MDSREKCLGIVLSLFLSCGNLSATAQVIGGGSTLAGKFYEDVLVRAPLPGFEPYINVGSGAGKRAFIDNDSDELVWDHDDDATTPSVPVYQDPVTVDYGGSDSLISQSEMIQYLLDSESNFGPLIQIPLAIAPVAIAHHVVGASHVELSSRELAGLVAGFANEDSAVRNWKDLEISPGVRGPDLPISIVFRADGSGTTEILTRHLNEMSSPSVPAVSNRLTDIFGFDAANPPPGLLAAYGDAEVKRLVQETPGAIGYLGPSHVDIGDPTKVVAISSNTSSAYLPSEVNVQAAIEQVVVPTTPVERANPLAWGISNPRPSRGYPIVGATHLLLSQCYESQTDQARILVLLSSLYGDEGTLDQDIHAHSLIPLPTDWKEAIYQTFFDRSDGLELAIGHPSECAARIGRPIATGSRLVDR